MLLTIALTVLCGAVCIFFSQEFIRIHKKIMLIPGVKLLLPLVLASLLIEMYEEWGRWLLIRLQTVLHQMFYKLSTLLPFETGAIFFIRVMYLFILAGLPLWMYLLWAKQKGLRHPKPFNYGLGLALWIAAVILLTVA